MTKLLQLWNNSSPIRYLIILIWLLVTQLRHNAYIVQLIINVALVIVSYWAHKLYSFK